MGGGGPPEVFKIVRYKQHAGRGPHEGYTTETEHVRVSAEGRAKIAELLGITDANEKQRMMAGTVYIHPMPPGGKQGGGT